MSNQKTPPLITEFFVFLATAFVAILPMAVAAINWPVGSGLEWQLGYLGAALGASPVALKHLALETVALRSLTPKVSLKSHLVD
ncbi:MAG: hypothetical protein LiPW39_477 [Parcubacteria group bacterium LiPW_39]|nr:MAG: hypothetical protein LiPW39_477 [Parcubacteria group bacterium LiPW_39]